jgi:hypothetical protein
VGPLTIDFPAIHHSIDVAVDGLIYDNWKEIEAKTYLNRYQSKTFLAVYKVPYNEYLVEISSSLACSRDYLFWFRLAVLGNI